MMKMTDRKIVFGNLFLQLSGINPMDSDHQASYDRVACRVHLQTRLEQAHRERERERQAILRALHTVAYSILPHFPRIRRVYLFGSVLCPRVLRRDSDVDIAIEGELSAEDYFALWRQLEYAVGDRPVDLVELDKDLHFAARVRETGELIYERPDSDVESGYRL
jgi:predicted nucleotidyltransferase